MTGGSREVIMAARCGKYVHLTPTSSYLVIVLKKKNSDTQHVPSTSRNLSLTLNAYIYHEQSVQERLMFGGVIEAREERLKLMREKMKKIEKMIEVENREVSK
jgi:hypothetical protein